MKRNHTQKLTLALLWRIIYILIQCTWAIPQTFVGFLLFLKYRNQPHTFYYGCIRTHWNRLDGISLGLFIFTANDSTPNHLKRIAKSQSQQKSEKMAVHEYGHTYQSLLLGPLYLPLVGLISFSWARLPRYQRMRKEYSVPYSFCWTEQWANYLGEKILKQPSLK